MMEIPGVSRARRAATRLALLSATLLPALLATMPAAPLQAQSAANVPVRPGDRVVVRLFDVPSTGVLPVQQVLVDERGDAELPLVGTMHVGGLPAAVAQDSIRARFRQIVRAGASAVTLERRIAVLGQVKKPDTYYVDLTTGLRDAIAKAGGIDELGRIDRVMLVRDGETITIERWQVDAAANRELHSGDQIIVPRESWFKRNAITSLSLLAALASVLVTVAK